MRKGVQAFKRPRVIKLKRRCQCDGSDCRYRREQGGQKDRARGRDCPFVVWEVRSGQAGSRTSLVSARCPPHSAGADSAVDGEVVGILWGGGGLEEGWRSVN